MSDELNQTGNFQPNNSQVGSTQSGSHLSNGAPAPQQIPSQTPLPTPQTPPAPAPQSTPLRQASSVQSTQVQPTPVQPTQVQPTQVQSVATPAPAQPAQGVQSPSSVQQSYAAPTQAQAVRQAVAASQTATDQTAARPMSQASASYANASQVAASYPAPQVRVAKQRKGIGAFGGFLLALLGGLIGAGALFAALTLSGRLGQSSITIDPSSGGGSSQTITINASDEDTSISKAVAAKALPSVVSFQVTTASGGGLGSGVVIDDAGNVLTNHHVIEGAQTILATIGDKSYEGTVVGEDASSDLAVVHLELNGDSVTPIELGDSSSLEVGDWVMTIGSPYGLDQSCSTGIVSSLYRSTMLTSVSGNTIYTNLIQTDAAINPGNSGGALVDSKGRLVGINSLNASYSGGSSGVGFAIPVNYAMQVADSIVAGKPVLHAYIGLSLGSVSTQDVFGAQLNNTQGAYVVDVVQNGPADAAGIQKGDIITAVDGKRVNSADALILAVRGHNIGDVVSVTLVRDGSEQSFEVTLSSDEALQGIDDTSEDRREELGILEPGSRE